MEDLQKRIGYTFKNTDLLTEALIPAGCRKA